MSKEQRIKKSSILESVYGKIGITIIVISCIWLVFSLDRRAAEQRIALRELQTNITELQVNSGNIQVDSLDRETFEKLYNKHFTGFSLNKKTPRVLFGGL